MIGDTIDITYNAVVKTLKKVNQDNFGAVYWLVDGLFTYELKISHTIPSVGGTAESHLVRLNVVLYDAAGAVVTEHSAWMVVKTFTGVQHADTDDAANALVGWLTPSNVTLVLGRES